MVNKLKEPMSYYMYKKRNPDMRKMINYSSILEHHDNRPSQRKFNPEAKTMINASAASQSTKNSNIIKKKATVIDRRSLIQVEQKKKYKGVNDILQEAKDENSIKIVNSMRVNFESKKRRRVASLRIKPQHIADE